MVCNFDALRDFSFALKRLAPATLAKSGTYGLRKVLPNSDFFFALTVEASYMYIQSQFDINVIPANKDQHSNIWPDRSKTLLILCVFYSHGQKRYS